MEIDCDASGLGWTDAQTIDLLARLQLAARRCGCSLRFVGVSPDLRELVSFCGLPLELERQAEEREKPLGVEEEGELADPPVA
jgi:anti-anti-sigma regulatory factor